MRVPLLPVWADILIVAAIPLILLGVLKLMGDDDPPDSDEDSDVLLAA